ncbi:MAG: TonB-dependent receptor [Gemmatimonadaceae bacterium]
MLDLVVLPRKIFSMRKPRASAGLLALSAFLVTIPAAYAQSAGRIAGIVNSTASGGPLADVTIHIGGTRFGALTASDGRYTIGGVPPGAYTVRATRIGYAPQSATVTVVDGETVTADFKLANQAVSLEEMVVVGYGSQKATTLTGSVSSVDAKAIEARSVSNPVQALQGKMPGLRVTQSNGQPGKEDVNLTIRGVGSFSGSLSPLIIVDNVVGSLSDLDPNSIESISVLKDASSASIYGARAANGVIIVTTKRGDRAQGLKANYGAKLMQQSLIELPDFIWNSYEWMQLHNTAIRNSGLGTTLYPDSIINLYKTPSTLYPSVNWAKVLFRDPAVKSQDLSFSGRSGQTNYYAGFGAWDQDGIMKGFYYQKYTATLNLDSRINDRINFGISLKGRRHEAKQPYNGPNDVMISLSRSRPTYGPLLPDGSGRYTSRAWPLYEPLRGEKNLIGLAENGGSWSGGSNVVGNVSTDVYLLENLKWTTRLGAQFDVGKEKFLRPLIPTYNWFTGAFDVYADQLSKIFLRQEASSRNYYTAYSTLGYDRSFAGTHNLAILVGTSVEKSTYENVLGTREGFVSPFIDVLGAGPPLGQTTGGNFSEYALASLFGRVNYNFREKYLAEVTVRRDGSSRFPPANKNAVFPAISAGWRISEEGFFEGGRRWVDDLKLRASYGLLGKDDIGNYPYQAAIRTGYDYPFGGSVLPGIARPGLNNDRIRWEETSIADFGVDLAAANRRLSFTADYYVKTTSGILRASQVPAYAGVSGPPVNEGVVRNTGVELALGHEDQVRTVQYGAKLIYSSFKNTLVRFGAPQIGGENIIKEGLEYNSYYLYQADGIYRTPAEIAAGPTPLVPAVPGDIRLRDVNGDGKITPDDRVPVSGRYPRYEIGLDLNAHWKNFDISSFLQGEQGRKVMVDSWIVRPFMGSGGVISWWRNAWSPQNPTSDQPRLVHSETSKPTSIWTKNTFWLRDASYLRLRNLTLGYTVPQSVVGRIGLGKARVYLNGENLKTWTPFEFGNPEQGSNTAYPVYRTLTFGLDVGF